MDLSVVIPTYNEKENIEEMVSRVDKECKRNGISAEIIVVDDNSPDGTWKIVQRMMKKKKNLRLILRKKREGLGVALFQGYQNSKGKVICSIDADLSIDPSYIPKVYKKIQDGYDLITGSRFMKAEDSKVVGKPKFKVWTSKGAALLASILFRMNLHDYTLNFRTFKRKVVPKTFESKGNVFLAEFLYTAKKRGFKVGEYPITFAERTRGRSKMRRTREIFLFLIALIKLRLKTF